MTSTGTDTSADVTVYAAASLTESLGRIADRYEAANPGATVTLNFAGSSALAQQIMSGAPVDVFASASADTMRVVVDAGLADGDPVVFAGNTLEIAVPPGNPAGVSGLTDLANTALTIALCAPEVPCGAASTRVLDAAGITAAPDTLETDVRAALTKVELGEVDAALVYRTDVLAAGDAVEGIEFAGAADAVTDYAITRVMDAANPAAAAAFVDLVLGDDGRRVLADAGFTNG
ncbi:molybdate ABC transporter substrate-binding protein [Marisediminicola senii]|uniref:molybdate ABC transporter substrate-binding protein n=1 Tax=Marisediminicola senii TaxID=2711233 RepID=UPI0013EA6DBA|nr:molybdate ABC transporter substrate-binding protein [Marisediminicola senii]